MHLNPFVRAFFRSPVPGQCLPVQDHILLVPTTDILLNSRDRESGTHYAALASTEEFLSSHVLRIPRTQYPPAGGGGAQYAAGSRERRSKARQFTTLNGRTVVIKDSWVYTHAGFRTLNQGQLLNDVIFYPDNNDAHPWLIYYISRPLVGMLETIPIPPKITPRIDPNIPISSASSNYNPKIQIRSFDELLEQFPMITRQIQPGLRKIFRDFGVYEKPLPETPTTPPPPLESASSDSPADSLILDPSEDEDFIRQTLESAIMSAIELFQRVDQSHLHLLATTTDLTGVTIEHLIERYVTEQLHDIYLFPRLRLLRKVEDDNLDKKISDMKFIDITQVGIPFTDQQSKVAIIKRITAGIERFQKLSDLRSPQAMLDVLLETAQALTSTESQEPKPSVNFEGEISSSLEKHYHDENSVNPVLTMNADMLVSLLLIVVIRSKLRNLNAYLTYMRRFIFTDDVEQGERGYALSTLEAVLFHIALDSDHMGRASKRNGRLWDKIRKGSLEAVKALLEKKEAEQFETANNEEEDFHNGEQEEEEEDHEAVEQDESTQATSKPSEVSVPIMTSDDLGDDLNDQDLDLEDDLVPEMPQIVTKMAINPNAPGEIIPELDDPPDIIKHNKTEIQSKEHEAETDTLRNAPTLSSNQQTSSLFDFDANSEQVAPKSENAESELHTHRNRPLVSALKTADPNIEIKENDNESLAAIILPKAKSHLKATFNPEVEYDDSPRPSRHRLSRSISMRSEGSRHSWASSFNSLSRSVSSVNEDLTSVEKLSKTQNANGESLVMMAVLEQHIDILEYLLIESSYYPLNWILENEANDGTTLLLAAVQGQSFAITKFLLREIMKATDQEVRAYINRKDSKGRTIGHYLFNQPSLIRQIGPWISWTTRDNNGQTPLFALCRSYDHPKYREMVKTAIKEVEDQQPDEEKLHLDDHVDGKGNTLLHIVHDQVILRSLLKRDVDVNAVNDKGLTTLMLASKYGRTETVRTLFADKRVDILAKESRGLMAVELAKDDEIRNKFDDMVMFTYPAEEDGRITAVVRGIFVEDATVRLVLKSGAPTGEMKYTITTCRRSLADFEFLAYWLAYEHPASWLPALHVSRSPFQIASKPSRAVLRDVQIQLDKFFRTLFSHATFSTHELLWEFFLVPELQLPMMIERSNRKCEIRNEKVQEEYEPVDETKDVEMFVSHAKEAVRSINMATRSLLRRINTFRREISDIAEAHVQVTKHIDGIPFLATHAKALQKYTRVITPNESNPFNLFNDEFRSIQASLAGIMTALDRPRRIISEMNILQKEIEKHLVSLRRSDRWPLGFMDDTRAKMHQDAADKARAANAKQTALSRELRYSQAVIAAELAAFHEAHEKRVKRAVKELAKKQVAVERQKLEGMRRALRGVVGVTTGRTVKPVNQVGGV